MNSINCTLAFTGYESFPVIGFQFSSIFLFQSNQDNVLIWVIVGLIILLGLALTTIVILARSRRSTPPGQTGIETGQRPVIEQQQRELAETLNRIGLTLHATLDLSELLQQICTDSIMLFRSDSAVVWLVQDDNLVAHIGAGPGSEQLVGQTVALTDHSTFASQVIGKNRPVYIDNRSHAASYPFLQRLNIMSILGLPLISGDNAIGVLMIIYTRQTQPLKADDLEYATLLGSYAAIAIQNAQLFEAEARRRYEAETLQQTTKELALALEPEEVLDNVLSQLRKVIPYDSACIFLVQHNRLKAVAGQGFPNPEHVIDQEFPADNPLIEVMNQTQQPLIIADARQDSRFVVWANNTYIRGWMGIPFVVRHIVIGYLTLDSRQANAYRPSDIPLAQAFAHQAAIAISNAQLFQQTQQALVETDALYQVSQALIALENLPNLLQIIVNNIAHTLPARWVTVITVDLATKTVGNIVSSDPDIKITRTGTYAELMAGLTGWAIQNERTATSLKDQLPDPRESPEVQQYRNEQRFGAMIVAPLQYREQILGTLIAVNRNDESDFAQRDVNIMQAMANQAAVAIENTRLFDTTQQWAKRLEVLHQVTHDLIALRDSDILLKEIVEQAVRLLGSDGGGISLYRPESQLLELVASVGSESAPKESTRLKPGQGVVGQTWLAKEPLIVNSYAEWPHRLPNWPDTIPQAAVAVPVHWGTEHIGVLGVQTKDRNRKYNHNDATVLRQFANHASIAIENARLYEQTRLHATDLENRVAKRTIELQMLSELAHALGVATQLSDVVSLALTHLHKAISFNLGASLLVTEARPEVTIYSDRPLIPTGEIQLRARLLETMPQEGFSAGLTPEIEYISLPLGEPPQELVNVLQAPLVVSQNTVGALLVASAASTPFTPEQERLFHLVADQTAETIGRLQSLLAAEYQRLENLVTHLPSGVILLDAEQQILLTNEIARSLMASLTQADIGDKLTALAHHSLADILAATAADTPFYIEINNRSTQAFEIDAKPIATGPEMGGYILVIRDVTDKRLLDRQIQQQERLAAVGQLAAGIAHDFNNILTSIIGFTELLLLDGNLSVSIRADLERITRQGHRAANLVRQILDFSRQTIAERHPLDLLPLLKEIISLFQRTLPEDIHIVLNATPAEYFIAADLGQIQQALTNLAVNARDAMASGGTLEFQLMSLSPSGLEDAPYSELTPGSWIVLKIIDTGVGIPKDLQEQIFEPFFTTKEVGKGTGLGLAQVYGIVKQHEGHITVDSQPDVGTTFSLYFPAYQPPKQTIPAPKTAGDLPRGRGQSILLVEDDLTVLDITTNMLTYLNYQVLSASNGKEALRIFQEHQQDIVLVLTDLTMPVMGGTELTMALRQYSPSVNVVALTGYPQESQAKQLLTYGIVEWLQKPLSLKQLANTLSRLVE